MRAAKEQGTFLLRTDGYIQSMPTDLSEYTRKRIRTVEPNAKLKINGSMYYIVDGAGERISQYKCDADGAWINALTFLNKDGRFD
jgi:hypothetical protein